LDTHVIAARYRVEESPCSHKLRCL